MSAQSPLPVLPLNAGFGSVGRWGLRQRRVSEELLAGARLLLDEGDCPAGDFRVNDPTLNYIVDAQRATLLAFWAFHHPSGWHDVRGPSRAVGRLSLPIASSHRGLRRTAPNECR